MKFNLPSFLQLFRLHAGKFLLLSLISAQALTISASEKSANYKQCWFYQTDRLTSLAPKATGNNLIFSLSDAELINLDAQNGNVIWKAELGGEIVSEPVATEQFLLVATKAEPLADAGGDNYLTIRALSVSTGLTIWQKLIPEAKQIRLALNDEKLIFAAQKSEKESLLSALQIPDGAIFWSKSISADLTTNIFSADSNLYFGTKGKIIYSIRAADGATLKQFKLENEAQNKLTVSNGIIFYGDDKGDIIALREADANDLWVLRTGGAVQDILPTARGLLVTSLDNFVYLHKYSNGDRQWRRRLAARPLSADLLTSETVLLLTNGESSAIVLNIKNGKILSQIPIGENNYAVSAAKIQDKFIVLPTKNGVLGLFQNSLPCPKNPEKDKEKGAN